MSAKNTRMQSDNNEVEMVVNGVKLKVGGKGAKSVSVSMANVGPIRERTGSRGGGAEAQRERSAGACEGIIDLTDTGNARALVASCKGSARFCTDSNNWMVWNGRVWEVNKQEMMRKTEAVVEGIIEQAKVEKDSDRAKALSRHAKYSASRGGRRNMEALARVDSSIQAKDADFERDDMLLTVANGVLDLRTGKLMDFDPGLMCRRSSPVTFDPKAKAPRWEAFVDEVMGGNKHLVEFIQKAIGYSLTGSTKEQSLFICHGQGRNGKTTLLNVVSELLGDFSRHARFAAFANAGASASGEATPEIARLRGARAVIASEGRRDSVFDGAVIKNLTGDKAVIARYLHQNPIEYRPSFKIWLGTNWTPRLDDAGLGMSRRIKTIPFNVVIAEECVNQDLGEVLKEEMSGILNWALRGCLVWQREGLGEPFQKTNRQRQCPARINWDDDTGEFVDAQEETFGLGQPDPDDELICLALEKREGAKRQKQLNRMRHQLQAG